MSPQALAMTCYVLAALALVFAVLAGSWATAARMARRGADAADVRARASADRAEHAASRLRDEQRARGQSPGYDATATDI